MRDERSSRRTTPRKAEHLRINIERDVNAKGITPGFEALTFEHRALPELDLDDVDLSIEFLGKRLRAPLLISCMTGGTPEAARINRTLAEVAAKHGLAMGLGSGRALLEAPETIESFAVRDAAPEILLFANLGAVQLAKGYGADQCRRLVDMLQADALVLHCNPLQEALQPEGDTAFRGLLGKIAQLCAAVDFPVVVKEVGWGIAGRDVLALFDAGVAAVDVAGAGGTSWSEVERHRISEPWRVRVAAAFSGWGIPTTDAIVAARRASPTGCLIASGGVRDGIDAAKAIALGADLVGLAGPFLRAADHGIADAEDFARQLIETLRIAAFCTGAGTIAELRRAPLNRVDSAAGHNLEG